MMTVRVRAAISSNNMFMFFCLHHGFQYLLYITFTHNSVVFKFYFISQANKLRMLFKKSKQTNI